MPNNRIHWAIQYVGIRTDATPGSSNWTAYSAVHGVQNFTMNANFNLEQVFEYGQLAVYENIENIPDIEATIEKVLDGYPLVYHLATQNATTPTLINRGNNRATIALGIYADDQEYVTGNPTSQVELSGVYVSALTYTFPVEGNCTESVSFVGNDRRWYKTTGGFVAPVTNPSTTFGSDSPQGVGGVQRRENLIMTAGSGYCKFPTIIPGIDASGFNTGNARLQNVTISANLTRNSIFELGRRGPYNRYIGFPIEVTTEIEVISHSGDLITATADGVNSASCGGGTNLTDQKIRIVTCDGTYIYVGDKNKLSSVNYTGGDTTGNNVTVTYSFVGYNILNVLHGADPVSSLRPFTSSNYATYLGND